MIGYIYKEHGSHLKGSNKDQYFYADPEERKYIIVVSDSDRLLNHPEWRYYAKDL